MFASAVFDGIELIRCRFYTKIPVHVFYLQ